MTAGAIVTLVHPTLYLQTGTGTAMQLQFLTHPATGAHGYRSPGNFNTPRARLRLPCVKDFLLGGRNSILKDMSEDGSRLVQLVKGQNRVTTNNVEGADRYLLCTSCRFRLRRANDCLRLFCKKLGCFVRF